MDRNSSVASLFRACDLDGSGFIDESELASICSELTSSELKDVFRQLDKDGDGKISVEEFSKGFKELGGPGKDKTVTKARSDSTNTLDETNLEEFIGDLDDGLKTLSCQEQVCELYQQLHRTGSSETLEIFESVILGVLKDLRQYQVDNERLEKSYKRDKEQHERHLRQMEDEMELQMQKVEDRVRQREEEKKESEKAEMKEQVQEEINMLQQNLKRLQQEGPEARNKEIEEQLLDLKGKVGEMTFANRQLKSELTDAQTNLALVKSELAAVKQSNNEKTHELDMEKETVSEYVREQDNLTRQLHLLHDANKRLHDTNDDLREALETSRRSSPMRQQSITSNASVRSHSVLERKGSLMSEYFQSSPLIRSRMNSVNSLLEEGPEHHVTTHVTSSHSPRLIRVQMSRQDTCEEGSIVEDIDSGRSTLRDGHENDLDNDIFLNDAESMQKVLNASRLRRSRNLYASEDLDSHEDFETESEAPTDHTELRMYKGVHEQRRAGSAGSRASTRSSRSREGRDMAPSRGPRRQNTLTQEAVGSRLSKEPERMFKVVLAGDAAVGKSSLIMRLCKGKFVSNLSSTLGVDFQTKIIELDGRTIALQLWDTAGQERFRSIAKSYFRRADGVLLLYDCTYERSFLSIRDWVESIEEGAIKKLPIMLCGNKTDLRPEAIRQGRRVVHEEDGQRVAREFGALFIEASAKDGDNISECVMELTRLMRANEDLEVKTCGLQLTDKPRNSSKGGCC